MLYTCLPRMTTDRRGSETNSQTSMMISIGEVERLLTKLRRGSSPSLRRRRRRSARCRSCAWQPIQRTEPDWLRFGLCYQRRGISRTAQALPRPLPLVSPMAWSTGRKSQHPIYRAHHVTNKCDRRGRLVEKRLSVLWGSEQEEVR